jgi:hypothetical protein
MKEDDTPSASEKEILMMEKKAAKLERSWAASRIWPPAGYRLHRRPPKEDIAVAEGQKTGVSLLAIVDSNCDPTEITYPIPATTTHSPSAAHSGGRRGADGKKLAEERLQAITDKEAAEAGEIPPALEAGSRKRSRARTSRAGARFSTPTLLPRGGEERNLFPLIAKLCLGIRQEERRGQAIISDSDGFFPGTPESPWAGLKPRPTKLFRYGACPPDMRDGLEMPLFI